MDNNITPVSNPDEFGLTEQDIKNNKYKSILRTIGFYFSKIAPTLEKILNGIIYYTIKFIKAFVGSLLRMAFKGE
ncbi:MAG TPA: hypothetical protein VHE53_01505 [Patescibacteria group bacterium]|nr:hypothetical protein [Patescibacteria group bacterium]